MAKVVKSTEKREDFILKLASMTDTEINDFIKRYGKKPKPTRMYTLIDPDRPSKFEVEYEAT